VTFGAGLAKPGADCSTGEDYRRGGGGPGVRRVEVGGQLVEECTFVAK
jgi:hypothetical protein